MIAGTVVTIQWRDTCTMGSYVVKITKKKYVSGWGGAKVVMDKQSGNQRFMLTVMARPGSLIKTQLPKRPEKCTWLMVTIQPIKQWAHGEGRWGEVSHRTLTELSDGKGKAPRKTVLKYISVFNYSFVLLVTPWKWPRGFQFKHYWKQLCSAVSRLYLLNFFFLINEGCLHLRVSLPGRCPVLVRVPLPSS